MIARQDRSPEVHIAQNRDRRHGVLRNFLLALEPGVDCDSSPDLRRCRLRERYSLVSPTGLE